MQIENEVIISLTSFPERIKYVKEVVQSVLNQTVKADKVVLWLAEEQFPKKEQDLPAELLDLKNCGLIIDWCKDIKSYKKLIPSLKKYPDAIIITIDDDIIFSNTWLEMLLSSYVKTKNKKYIYCHRVTRLRYRNNKFSLFKRKKYNNMHGHYYRLLGEPSVFNKLSGGAGCLYPPGCFDDEIFNENIFMKYVPTSDDIWFYFMALRNGCMVKAVENNQPELNYVKDSQQGSCLSKINDTKGHQIFYKHLNFLKDYYAMNKIFANASLKNEFYLSLISLAYLYQKLYTPIRNMFIKITMQKQNEINAAQTGMVVERERVIPLFAEKYKLAA